MAKGRKNTPTAALLARGTFRPSRHASRADVVTPIVPGVPDAPAWLSAEAIALWPPIVADLAERGLMSEAYIVGAALLCDALADWHRFTAAAAAQPDVITGSTGAQIANPLQRLKAQAWERTMKAAREFGLTPVAVANVIAMTKADGNSDKSRFFPSPGLRIDEREYTAFTEGTG